MWRSTVLCTGMKDSQNKKKNEHLNLEKRKFSHHYAQ